ncbi:FadR/GntR family transcriptional regulator [Roseibium salinum]|uniref:FadR/GntR family transcriptional regulator n=1 Tax=Roseibium salinum TaxID=1604349 RepID=UPI0029E0355D|nr:FadR/GntR family transcriptional regulator [Roseibium salinum]
MCEKLRTQIEEGKYAVGDRLPSEARLTEEFSVSRTVIREAVATLRADGLLDSRQGAGVFVLAPAEKTPLPFQNVEPARISSMIEMLELRTAVETEAAALAARRRSPAQLETLFETLHTLQELFAKGESSPQADFDLHMAIADATNNPRFREFLELVGPGIIPRRALATTSGGPELKAYVAILDREHGDIVQAIADGNADEAREAMRNHLLGSQARYRALLRRTTAGAGKGRAAMSGPSG